MLEGFFRTPRASVESSPSTLVALTFTTLSALLARRVIALLALVHRVNVHGCGRACNSWCAGGTFPLGARDGTHIVCTSQLVNARCVASDSLLDA